MRSRTAPRLVTCLLALWTLDEVAGQQARIWADTKGRRVKAEFLGAAKGIVSLESSSGKVHRVKSSSLSREDQSYLESLKERYGTTACAVVSVKNVSYANVVRKSYRAKVPGPMSKQELTAIARRIVGKATSEQTVHSLMIFFYLPESDPNGTFTAGKATWAPDGEWGKASTGRPAKLVIEEGSVTGALLPEKVVDLPAAKKKQIFTQIVRFQDRGIDDKQSFAAAAKRFGITTEQAENIGWEGIAKGWPMP